MKRVIGLVGALGVLLPGVAHAQATGFAAQRFEPSERGSEWFSADSLDLRGRVRPIIGVVGDYGNRPLVIYDAGGEPRTMVLEHQLLAHVGGGVVLFDRLRLAASLPISLVNNGETGNVGATIVPGPKNEVGVGDLRFGADVRVFGKYRDVVTGALGAQLWIPTGDEANYLGDGKVRVAPHFTVAGDVGPFVYSAKPGFTIRPRDDSFAGVPLGHEITLAMAAGVRVFEGRTVIGPEVFMSTGTEDFFAKRTTPVEGLIGIHHTLVGGLRLGAGAGLGLARGLGTPQARALVNIEWMPEIEEAKDDRDGDGILDADDACPEVRGEASSDRSQNGCPPGDRDKDGVLDRDDACPDTAGAKTSDPKTNGCPADRDQDGILDSEDACIDVPGVKTSDPKTNGCPPDSDGDGVADKDDACPSQAGPKTNDPKTNGCPEDRDKDGIANTWDACPDEPGPKDPDPKKNGCPKAFVKAGKIQILDQVRFKTASATIDPGKDSEDVLKAVQKVLTEHPEIKKLRVEGHTDNRGSNDLNKKLSADRAASVVKWLTAHGIAENRLSSAGFGPDKPIASNETEEGRLTNRRVEFHIEGEAK